MARVRYVHVPPGTAPPQFLGQPDRRPVIGPAIQPAQQKQSAFLDFYVWIGILGIGGLLVGVLLFNEFRSPGATAELVQWLTSGQFVKDTPGMVQDTMRGERTVQVESAVGNPPTPVPSTGHNFTAPSGPVPTSAPNIVAQPGPAPVVVDLVPTAAPPEVVITELEPLPTKVFDALDMQQRQTDVAAICVADRDNVICQTPPEVLPDRWVWAPPENAPAQPAATPVPAWVQAIHPSIPALEPTPTCYEGWHPPLPCTQGGG